MFKFPNGRFIFSVVATTIVVLYILVRCNYNPPKKITINKPDAPILLSESTIKLTHKLEPDNDFYDNLLIGQAQMQM